MPACPCSAPRPISWELGCIGARAGVWDGGEWRHVVAVNGDGAEMELQLLLRGPRGGGRLAWCVPVWSKGSQKGNRGEKWHTGTRAEKDPSGSRCF